MANYTNRREYIGKLLSFIAATSSFFTVSFISDMDPFKERYNLNKVVIKNNTLNTKLIIRAVRIKFTKSNATVMAKRPKKKNN